MPAPYGPHEEYEGVANYSKFLPSSPNPHFAPATSAAVPVITSAAASETKDQDDATRTDTNSLEAAVLESKLEKIETTKASKKKKFVAITDLFSPYEPVGYYAGTCGNNDSAANNNNNNNTTTTTTTTATASTALDVEIKSKATTPPPTPTAAKPTPTLTISPTTLATYKAKALHQQQQHKVFKPPPTFASWKGSQLTDIINQTSSPHTKAKKPQVPLQKLARGKKGDKFAFENEDLQDGRTP